PGASALANNLPALYLVPFLYLEFREMHVERKQALAVVYNHAITFVVQIARQQDRTCVGCPHGCAGGCVKIQPLMRCLVDPVDPPRRPEDRENTGFDRRVKWPEPIGLW